MDVVLDIVAAVAMFTGALLLASLLLGLMLMTCGHQ